MTGALSTRTQVVRARLDHDGVMNATSTHLPHRPRYAPALQAAALFVGAAVSTWWSTRTRPEEVAADEGFPLSEAEYAIAPITLPLWAETLLGVGALLLTVAMATLLVRAVVSGRLAPRWGLVILLLTPIPVMAGLWWMIATAPIIGANIGLGLAAMTFGPATLILLIAAAVTAFLALRAR